MRYLPLTLAALLAACDAGPSFIEAEPGEVLSAGEATVTKTDQNAFSLPLANLSPSRRLDFSVGNSFFRNPWVIAPASTDARDGLGPLFNTNACQNCHIKDGRGHPPAPDAKQAVSMLVRLSVPAGTDDDLTQSGLMPEPTYGGQFQDAAIPGVEPEGRVRVDYRTRIVTFEDGYQVALRVPRLSFSNLAYGEMHPATLFSARIAPPVIGLGCWKRFRKRTCWPMPTRRMRTVMVSVAGPTGSGIAATTPPPWGVSAGKPASPVCASRMRKLSPMTWG